MATGKEAPETHVILPIRRRAAVDARRGVRSGRGHMIKPLGGRGGLLLSFGLLSLAAVVLGAFVSAASGVPAGLWVRNLAAWAVGAMLAVPIAAALRPGALPLVLWLAPAGLAATLLSPDLQG